MKLAVKIAAALIVLCSVGFCLAFVVEEVARRAMTVAGDRSESSSVPNSDVDGERSPQGAAGNLALPGSDVAVRTGEMEVDALLAATPVAARYRLESELAEMDSAALEERFFEFMARDLENARAIEYAGRALQEIATRSPGSAVALLSALTAAERESLAPAMARGWVAYDPASAFDWIETAWIDAEGDFIDRAMQRRLYAEAMEVWLDDDRNYSAAANRIESMNDPDLKVELTALFARRAAADGPEIALERLATVDSEQYDASIMNAIAREWAARDSEGAMAWGLDNQDDVAIPTVRSIAKQLIMSERRNSLAQFHTQLAEPLKRDNVAAEAARLLARREPLASVDWALAIVDEAIKTDAVLSALQEIGYESFTQSVDYIDTVYRPDELARSLVLHSTLRDWLPIDPPAVAEYLASPRARLAPELTQDLLR